MTKCIELLPCDWLISNLCYQAIEQVHLIKWPVSVYTIHIKKIRMCPVTSQNVYAVSFSFLVNIYIMKGNETLLLPLFDILFPQKLF